LEIHLVFPVDYRLYFATLNDNPILLLFFSSFSVTSLR